MTRPITRIAVSLLAAATCVVLTAGSGGAKAGDPTLASTDKGPVRGVITDGSRTFQGVPYAAPPVGELRWRAPRPAAAWSAPRDATRPGNTCPQAGGFPGDQPSLTEDCLNLNVTSPPQGRRLPVMVWLHGGGFFGGAGSDYDPRPLAVKGGVVVVTLNYRLGALGFLAHPALDAAQKSGDFGLEDQQAALGWVHRNIAAFGGDPGRVTLFGESAGGVSTCAHLTAPGSAGLFQRAIIQSGSCTLRWPYSPTWAPLPRATAEAYGISIAKKLGCSDSATVATCLRSKPAQELVALTEQGEAFSPAYGGGALPADPARSIATGHFIRVPVIEGTTRDEYRTFQAGLENATKHRLTEDEYPTMVKSVFGDDAGKVLARYPVGRYGSASVAWSAVVTDWGLTCPTLTMNNRFATYVPTYAYEFADEHTPWFRAEPDPGYPTGAYHAGELQYLFKGVYYGNPLTSGQKRLSDQMISYWTHFAYSGNPGAAGQPVWPKSTPGVVLSLAPGHNGIHPTDAGSQHQCRFWNGLH
jgi:para-nitrobenzyl esterase